MNDVPRVRIGVVGVGSRGGLHARELLAGKIAGAELAAVCDVDSQALAQFGSVERFSESDALIRSGLVDALLIATPHYAHTPIAVAGLGAGLHVLCEKPLSVHKADCERVIRAYHDGPNARAVFAEMFDMRVDPRYRALRNLLRAGELGRLVRITWIASDWFRTEAYYRSRSWRATWEGEGGGVLINQAAHNLDLWQWLFGMPQRVRAFCGFGRFHAIEVEDQVTAHLEYDGGASGVFITATGEAPGTNRLEVAGDRGKVVLEGESLVFVRNEVPASEYSRESLERNALPPVSYLSLPVSAGAGYHLALTQNFVNACLHGEELLAPGTEGIHSVELANAMIYSELTGATVELPLDSGAFAHRLERLIEESRARAGAH
jgi:predicted dehydrogenase